MLNLIRFSLILGLQFAQIDFGFNEEGPIPEGTELPLGPADGNTAGTVDLDNFAIYGTVGGMTTFWGDGEGQTVSGKVKILGYDSTYDILIIAYQVNVMGASRNILGEGVTSVNVGLNGSSYFDYDEAP